MKKCKKILAVLLCFSFIIVSVVMEPVPVQAESELAFVNQCFDNMTSFETANTGLEIQAWAYLKGKDDVVKSSKKPGYEVCDLYAVEPDVEIQGKKIDSKWLPQNNHLYLKEIVQKYVPNSVEVVKKIRKAPEGFQGTQREGTKVAVVDYDEDWVTVWNDGFQIWNVRQTDNSIFTECSYGADAYLETHPAGFYKIKRKEVWIDFGLSSNHPYQSEAEIPKAGSGIVTKLAYLRPVPNEKEKKYTPVYALPMGTTLNVVSTELVASEAPGSTRKYYKVSFNGGPKVANNTVAYMQYNVPGVYYIDSRFLNVTRAGTTMPDDAAPGKIVNVKSGKAVYVYQSKDTGSEPIGVLTLGTKIWMFPAESYADWTTVYFSEQKAYVQTKNIRRELYKVTDISRLRTVTIVNDEIKVGWNVGKNNVEYACSIATTKGKVLWSDAHYKRNRIIVGRKYIDKYSAVDVWVQATDKNGIRGKILKKRIVFPMPAIKKAKKKLVIGRTKIKCRYRLSYLGSSLQYSTDKKFTKAVTLERYYKKGKKTGYKSIVSIKKLKPNTTYYIRWRRKQKYWTSSGYKWLSGKWTTALKIKTKA